MSEKDVTEKRGGTNMCEFLDRVEARGETRGLIKGTITTCLEFGMDVMKVVEKIMQQFHLDEREALKYM